VTTAPDAAAPREPAWMRETDLALTVHPQVLFTGNVRDIYLVRDEAGERYVPLTLVEVIERVCTRRGYGGMAVHDTVGGGFTAWQLGDSGMALPGALAELVVDRAGQTPKGAERALGPVESPFIRLRRALVAAVENGGPPLALAFPYTARLGSPRNELTADGKSFFAAVEALAHEPSEVPGPRPVMPYNTVFWVAERQEELPVDFVVGNKALRIITIPFAPPDQRLAAAIHAVGVVAEAERTATGRSPGPDRLLAAAKSTVKATAGMGNAEILAVSRMALDRGLPADRLDEAARLYRIGVVDNPWTSEAVRENIRNGEEYLNARVIGQLEAVRRTVGLFKRSAVDLTGAQSSSSPHRPRGVLFLSGPTGVGKTELAKGIATMIFGDDATPVRFDMSEFSQEHARDRLIGAPPGFVGHEAGGELTNAVRANPMSVLLFDEIDKADPRLFDLFLQILEDGRLTDGRGSTVYFSECVLIFTSNLGITEKRLDGSTVAKLVHTDDSAKVQRVLTEAFEDFFDSRIQRPELRNRFGDGFVVMDYIRPEHVPAILDRSLEAVITRVAESHRARLEITPAAHAALRREAASRLAHGGRGVGNAVEAALVNPLSHELFERLPSPGETISVEGVVQTDSGWRLEVRRWRG
jgi:AAA domain (Cdc48 subfamily)/C-terminal, D2-small domain, of ClpB protein